MSLDDMKKVFNKSQKDICIEALNKAKQDGFTNEYIRALQSNIDKVGNISTSEFIKVLNRKPTDDDIVSYWAYYFYTDCKLTLRDFAKVISINESDSTYVNMYGYRFEWNIVKSELNLIKHKLRFMDAIELLFSKDTKKFKVKESDRCVSFAFSYNGVFCIITVDFEDGRTIRIISFRDSTKEEYNRYEGDSNYERLV